MKALQTPLQVFAMEIDFFFRDVIGLLFQKVNKNKINLKGQFRN